MSRFPTNAELFFEQQRFMKMPRYFVGLDLGQARDYTAVAVCRRFPVRLAGVLRPRHEVVGLDRYRAKPYPTIVKEVADLMARPELWRHPDLGNQQPPVLVVDGTGVGAAIVDMFVSANMSCDLMAVTITAGEAAREEYRPGCRRAWVPKRDLAGVLQLASQENRFQVAAGPHAETLRSELENFRVKVTTSGHSQFGAGCDWRDGNHDDLVLAVALAAWSGEQPGPPTATVRQVTFTGPGAPGPSGRWGSDH